MIWFHVIIIHAPCGCIYITTLPLNTSFRLSQLPVSLECYTVPPEDNLALLQLYFRTLVTGALRPHWCPVLYAVAVAHVNSFIFSQDPQSSVSYISIFRGRKRAASGPAGGEVLGTSPRLSATSPCSASRMR